MDRPVGVEPTLLPPLAVLLVGAMLRMAEFLARANEEANYTNDSLLDTNRAAAEGALAANELAVALEGAEVAAGGVLGTVDQLPGAIDDAAAAAARRSP